jgi:hypothetical protein
MRIPIDETNKEDSPTFAIPNLAVLFRITFVSAVGE